MSGGIGVIAGPEVDMTELEAATSTPLAVDLNLNLGPSFALELGLGGQDFQPPVQASRPNWPRFEPGMAGMLLAVGPEEETPAMVEDQPRNSVPQEMEQGSFRGYLQETMVGQSEASPEALSARPRMRRNLRHMRYFQPLRQQSPASFAEFVETQSSTNASESNVVGATDPGPSIAHCRSRTTNNNINSGLVSTCPEVAPLDSKELKEATKAFESGQVGAHFDCNICLETATEPVVTCCGHLFCWPCLYQWLHVHARQKDCPVCKGSLSDGVITPIYGRGCVKDTDKPQNNIPARPHARRINVKRQWQEITLQDSFDDVAAGPERSEQQVERSEAEDSAAEEVLNRLRVAQRLQREHLDERFRMRLRQRIIGRRRASSRRSSAVGSGNSVEHAREDTARRQSEQQLTRMAINRLETADSLAAIGASIVGLRENLAHMRRSLHFATALSTQLGASISEEGGTSGTPHSVVLHNDEMVYSSRNYEGQTSNENMQLPQGSSEPPQSLATERYGAEASSSRSFDTEPGLLHARKRRRLN